MSILSDLVESIVDAPGEFIDVAAQGPIEALLVAMGILLVGLPLVFFGVLVLGAAIELVATDNYDLLVERLATYDIIDVSIRETTLEDILIHFYRDD